MKYITLGEICKKGSSNIAQKDLEGNIGDYEIYGASGFIKKVDFYHQEKPYIGIVKDGAGVGRTMLLPAKSSVIGTMQYILPNDDIDIRYLYYAIDNMNLGKYYMGAAIPHIYFKDYQSEKLPVRDIQAQKQIADVLAKTDALIANRKAQLIKLDELVKSRFIELFGEPFTNSKGWKTECLFSVAPTKQIPFEFSDKVWLLNLDAVESNTGMVLFKNIVSDNEVNASTVMFSTDNVLYSKLRPYLNKVVLPDDKGVATSELLPLYPDKAKLNRVYLCYWLRSDAFVKHISEKVAGAKMPRVSMDYFRSIDIELPPIDLQNQFAEFVEQTDKLKLAIQQSLEKLETLKKTLMQQYFG